MERVCACEVKVAQGIKHSLDQIRVHGCLYDDLRDDLVKPGLASGQVPVWQVTMRRAFRSSRATLSRHRQVPGPGRRKAIVTAAAHENIGPGHVGDHGLLGVSACGAVQDALADVTAGFLEGHHSAPL
jgi:hypothetical protein